MSAKLTRDQKHRLAGALTQQAGNLIEFWHEHTTDGYHQDLADIDREAAAQQFANWLKDLPGDAWDVQLPQPERQRPAVTQEPEPASSGDKLPENHCGRSGCQEPHEWYDPAPGFPILPPGLRSFCPGPVRQQPEQQHQAADINPASAVTQEVAR